MNRLVKTLVFIFCMAAINSFAQIVPPGQVELVLYPGSNIDNIDNTNDGLRSEAEKPVRLFLLDEFSEGTLCVNSQDCYSGLTYNIDLLNEVFIIKGQGEENKYLSLIFMDRLYDSLLNKTFSYEILDKKTNLKAVSQVYFQQQEVRFFKKYSVKKLQANYQPQFDTGSKEPTYEVESEYVFIDENESTVFLKKLKERYLLKNLPDSELKKYLSKEGVKIRSEEDLIKVLAEVYSENS